jgi:hypothetical protein
MLHEMKRMVTSSVEDQVLIIFPVLYADCASYYSQGLVLRMGMLYRVTITFFPEDCTITHQMP